MGDDRVHVFGLTDRELMMVFAVAEFDGYEGAANYYKISRTTVKNHLHNARQKAGGIKTTLGLYHRLVGGLRFETHVTTRVVRED